MQNNVIILIPIYKEHLSDTESISLNRCLKVLSKYPICFVTFKMLNTKEYDTICKKYKVEMQKEYFDAYYFQNDLIGYNSLMLSKKFYKKFLKFTYLLIYQLDAYVFRDDIEYWCNKHYSFIGGPVFEGYLKCNQNSLYLNCMNGGVSLRKTKDIYTLIKSINKIEIFENIYEKGNIFQKIKALCMIFLSIDIQSKYTPSNNEDLLISYFFIEKINRFLKRKKFFKTIDLSIKKIHLKFPTFNETYHFCFDENIEHLYELSNHTLPTFCHAFHSDNKREFWSKFIDFIQ